MIYVYRCKECKSEFQSSLKVADRKKPESEPCPSCEKDGCVVQAVTAASLTPIMVYY